MILITIGRNPGNKIVINNHAVSDYHAEIRIGDDGSVFISDKSSTNGTTLKGRKIPKESEVSVNRGDKITFAGVADLDWNQIPVVAPLPPGWSLYGIGSHLNNRIQINDPSYLVSRFHATLKIDPKGKMYINDHSANGTFVDGIRIPANQDYPVKRKNKIKFANTQPLEWKLIKGKPRISFAKAATVLLIVLLGVWGGFGWKAGWWPFSDGGWEAYQSSTTMIYHAFYYEVVYEDEAIGKFELGMAPRKNAGERPVPQLAGIEGTEPFDGMGTGFFVSNDGKIVTNKHIATPWEYITPELEDDIRNYMAYILNNIQDIEVQRYTDIIDERNINYIRANIRRIRNNNIKSIRGRTVTLRAGFYNKYYESLEKFEPCKVLKTSNEPEIDLAILQINDKVLPPSVKKIIDVSRAEAEDKKLRVGDRLTTIGYSAGAAMNYRPDEDGLKPTIKSGNLQRDISTYSFDINVELLGGSSGSPVFNDSKQLVGVINSGYTGSSTFGKGILAKHIRKILDETNN
ncbi:MAG: FHA domain-containing protein [Tannerellaceae bacterium]|jgi:pSer/pThr/pTyr-binding forkhead associated (FHA) protein/V8-like Glu-specific endopeptidase|nr:FHA domain-containing protein [Tannerellaceae bacterium]